MLCVTDIPHSLKVGTAGNARAPSPAQAPSPVRSARRPDPAREKVDEESQPVSVDPKRAAARGSTRHDKAQRAGVPHRTQSAPPARPPAPRESPAPPAAARANHDEPARKRNPHLTSRSSPPPV